MSWDVRLLGIHDVNINNSGDNVYNIFNDMIIYQHNNIIINNAKRKLEIVTFDNNNNDNNSNSITSHHLANLEVTCALLS